MTEEDWDFTVDLCLKGVFFAVKHEARRMIDAGRGGAIVNVASLNSRVPMFFGSAYAAAKAGVVSLGPERRPRARRARHPRVDGVARAHRHAADRRDDRPARR